MESTDPTLEEIQSEPLMQLFRHMHLPEPLRAISRSYCDLARKIAGLPRNPERSTALRKLRESKDCAVTASIWVSTPPAESTVRRLLPALVALVAACASAPHVRRSTSSLAATFVTAELEDYAVRAALLDPRCYAMAGTAAGGLDVTVPPGHSWHVTNAFAVYYGDPISVAQDAYPLTRRTGFIRPLDARRPLTLGSGTRIRSNVGINLAYVLYCDPAELWASDVRYLADPRGLYYGRLRRLRDIPTEMVTLESTGGGAIDDDIHATLPAVKVMLTSASAYDVAWITALCPGWTTAVNLLSEINNAHAVRFAESLLHPMPDCGVRITLQKGSLGDTWGPATVAVGVFSSADPAIANPIHGSGSVTFQRLPADW